ncbi:hypothetical protein CR513_05202, partial [Mucuna pruriens]
MVSGLPSIKTPTKEGEFTSNEFEEFCNTYDMTRQITATYTPQQNGVAERKNKTVMNLVRCTLVEKQVPEVILARSCEMIIISRDFVFEENEGWNWGRSKEEMAKDVLEWGESEDGGNEATNEGDLGNNEEAGSNETNGVSLSGISSPSK